ncbi:hypothetical protein EKO23_23285 [Nocardioides guangzhouensis]|uniref:Uncharacterized protein n=1 Tax=Nocardioides guangzhouensis TaxID=2497878 RepID=A0A4Q4Z2P2_9ACTN|nr:hypothetical protein [Nocardioides guangzhouensis]RYP81608.1 hypothetical protein EKO23_23285 [Nocardioides guangzhouensis]
MSHPLAHRPPRSAAHAVRRALVAAVALTAVCAAAFGAVALLVDHLQLDMSVQPAQTTHPAA